MKSEKVVLRNEFHNKKTVVRLSQIDNGYYKGYYRMSHRTLLRVRAALCGGYDCMCGDFFGARPAGQLFAVDSNSKEGYYVVALREQL